MTKKSYILSFTPNPSLDLGGETNKPVINEKNYIANETRFAGGNAINASRILFRLKTPVITSGFIGGSTGEEILNLLQKEKLKTNFVKIKNNSRTCVTVSNEVDQNQVRFNFPGPVILKQEKNKMLKFLQGLKNVSLIIIGGSLPPGVVSEDILQVMKMANKKNINCVVDCPAPILKKIIRAKPLMIKPNLAEFQQLMNTKATKIKDIQKLSKKLLKYVPYICISSVEGGAIIVTKDHTYFGKIPQMKINSTVGAGDSMVGAMSRELFKKNPDAGDILRWGLAASAATLMKKGTQLGTAKDIKRIYKKIKIQQIISL